MPRSATVRPIHSSDSGLTVYTECGPRNGSIRSPMAATLSNESRASSFSAPKPLASPWSISGEQMTPRSPESSTARAASGACQYMSYNFVVPGSDHLQAGEARAPVHVVRLQATLGRPDARLEPGHQGQVVAETAEQGHGGVGVPVDQARHQRAPVAIDARRRLGAARRRARPPRSWRRRADRLHAVEGHIGDGQCHSALIRIQAALASWRITRRRSATSRSRLPATPSSNSSSVSPDVVDTIGHVVDHAHGRVRETELLGHARTRRPRSCPRRRPRWRGSGSRRESRIGARSSGRTRHRR